MGAVLRSAIVTAAFLLVQGAFGGWLLGRRGRPYRWYIVVIHVILFVFIAAGWFFTTQGLSAVAGNHVGSWIAQILMGLGVALLLVGGLILAAGRKVPAPRGLVGIHQLGTGAAILGSLAGILFMLLGI